MKQETKCLIEFWAAAMAGDCSQLRQVCAPNCQIWHSFDNKWMSHREALDGFEAAREQGAVPSFEDVRLVPTAKGFLCQASMVLGRVGRLHITQLVTVSDGQITHVEEYIAPEMDLAAQLAG